MLNDKHFYGVVIGSEILQNRREDAHFSFLRDVLLTRHYELFSLSIIKDDPDLIRKTFQNIKEDPKAVLFSFGGIGSTPDDLTRAIAAEVFTEVPVQRHPQFAKDIVTRFGDASFPFRICMSDIPEGSHLLPNPINNMSGFHLNQQYFFVPGFPEMAHPMVKYALENFFPIAQKQSKYSMMVYTSEDKLIPFMQELSKDVELSCLPMMVEGKPQAELTLQSYDQKILDNSIEALLIFINLQHFSYKILEEKR